MLSTTSNNPEQIASKFLEFLGHEDLSFEFVMRFNELLNQTDKREEKKTKNAHLDQIAPIASKKESKLLTNNNVTRVENEQPKKIKEGRKSLTTKPTIQPSNQPTQSKSTKGKKEHKSKEKLQSLQEIDDAIKILCLLYTSRCV